jgi:hypothetical protein
LREKELTLRGSRRPEMLCIDRANGRRKYGTLMSDGCWATLARPVGCRSSIGRLDAHSSRWKPQSGGPSLARRRFEPKRGWVLDGFAEHLL